MLVSPDPDPATGVNSAPETEMPRSGGSHTGYSETTNWNPTGVEVATEVVTNPTMDVDTPATSS